MHGSEVRFYADLQDLGVLLDSFNDLARVTYTETLSDIDMPLVRFNDARNLMRYLRTEHPQPSKVFIITDEQVEINTQAIEMRDGSGTKLKADQSLNPDGVLLKLGGELESVLVAMSVNTMADTSRAKQLFKRLKKAVASKATCINGFYVLPGAFRKWKDGWRLTPSPGYSSTEDLKEPAINSPRGQIIAE